MPEICREDEWKERRSTDTGSAQKAEEIGQGKENKENMGEKERIKRKEGEQWKANGGCYQRAQDEVSAKGQRSEKGQ